MWNPRYVRIALTSLCGLALLELHGGSSSLAAPPVPAGEVISRCADRPSARGPTNSQDLTCPPVWSEELRDQSAAPAAREPWGDLRWGPLRTDEFELSLLYRPGERRPLWGY